MSFKKFLLKIVRVIISITQLEEFHFDKKFHESILIYDISYKTLIGPKALRIRFNKIDGFIIIFDGSKYLVLLGPEK